MANVAHLASSNYLSGVEISKTPVPYTIKSAEIKTFDDGSQKVELGFYETDKALLLNKTRLNTMMDMFGPETSGWINRKIALYGEKLTTGKFSGQHTIKIVGVSEPQRQPQNGPVQSVPVQPVQSVPVQPVQSVPVPPQPEPPWPVQGPGDAFPF